MSNPDQITAPRLLLVCPQGFGEWETTLAAALAHHFEPTVLVDKMDKTPASGPAGNSPLHWLETDRLEAMPKGELPDVICFSAPPSESLRWKIWRWKRWRNPAALCGGHWQPDDRNRASLKERLVWKLAAATTNFFFAPGAEEISRLQQEAGVHRQRILPLTGKTAEDARQAAEFLRERLAAERRTLLWVEEDVSLNSPSTKHLVYSVPHLLAEGWELSVWCFSAGGLDERVSIHRFPALPRRLGSLAPYWFWLVANFRGLTHRLLTGQPPARLVHTMGGAYLGADISSIHFVNHLWLRRQWELGIRNAKAAAVFLWTIPAAFKDQLQFSNPSCALFLPVSESIAEEVRRRIQPGAVVKVLPNSYDETRFNPVVRAEFRASMRAELGFSDGHTVFCFASQGHYQRKGFWLAVEALAFLRLRDEFKLAKPFRFLVIGGQPKTLSKLQMQLTERYPRWQEWIVFVGMQSALEKYYAAADAFLFPSYFEAFCLAEIEAGALGLPLLLTPHHGTEMILRPGENGLRLNYDPREIESALANFLRVGLPPFRASAGRGLDRAAYAVALASIYHEFGIKQKKI